MKNNDNRILAFNTAKLIEPSELQDLSMAAGSFIKTGNMHGGDTVYDV